MRTSAPSHQCFSLKDAAMAATTLLMTSSKCWAPCFTALLMLCGVSCSSKASNPDPQCVLLVNKIAHCDKSASQMPAAERDRLRVKCAPVKKCAKIDTSLATGCTRFMGCLYDPD